MHYYVVDKHGARFGPASVPVLNQWIIEGRINRFMQVDVVEAGVRMPITSFSDIMFPTGAPPVTLSTSQYHSGSGFNQGQAPYPRNGYPVQIENHRVKSILVTLFCCMPLGIVAIVFSAQVDGHARCGDVAETPRVYNLADTFANWSLSI